MKRRAFKADKLSRDMDIETMRADNIEVLTSKVTNKDELQHYFNKKLLEEAQEVCESSSQEHLLEELADCLEVIHGYAHSLGKKFEDIDRIREEKKRKRGGFFRANIIDSFSLAANHHSISLFENQPSKYKELDESL